MSRHLLYAGPLRYNLLRYVLHLRHNLDNDCMQVVPELEPSGQDLLMKMLRYEPGQRITARAAMAHSYFVDVRNLLQQHAGI